MSRKLAQEQLVSKRLAQEQPMSRRVAQGVMRVTSEYGTVHVKD
jgi:hypothetical protein